MIGGPLALALALAAHPPCSPDPTLTARPTHVNCSPSRVGEIHGDYRCTRSDNMVDGHNHVCYMTNSVDLAEGVVGRFDWIRLRTDANRAFPSD